MLKRSLSLSAVISLVLLAHCGADATSPPAEMASVEDGGASEADGSSSTPAPISPTEGVSQPPPEASPDCIPKPGSDVPDDANVDLNCDGIVGDKSMAIFVAPTGNDAASGTVEQPVKTFTKAISLAGAAGKAVYACNGTYAEAVTITKSIKVYGGYDCANRWARGTAADARAIITSPGAGPALTLNAAGESLFDRIAFVTKDGNPGESAIAIRAQAGTTTLRHGQVTAGKGGAGLANVSVPAPPPGPRACNGVNDCGNGVIGANGGAGSVSQASFDGAGAYHPGNGGAGTPGAQGANGTAAAPGTTQTYTYCCENQGSVVPNSGTCGCGGGGGAAGYGGGGGFASVGVLAVGAHLVLQDTKVSAAAGGVGAAGTGGATGSGGSGPGTGAAISVFVQGCGINSKTGEYYCKGGTTKTYSGTTGGAGAPGGAGGAGAGGAGGPSYGVVTIAGGSVQTDVAPVAGPGGAGASGAATGDSAATHAY